MPPGHLIIVVDQRIEALDRVLDRLLPAYPVVSIGRELSSYLSSSHEIDQARLALHWLNDRLREQAPGPIVCHDVDLLFHPSLKIDPLALLRRVSQFTKLIVLWPGEYKDGVLSYARSEHKHYRFWKNLEDVEIKGVYDDALS
jgi:hypothetical protein